MKKEAIYQMSFVKVYSLLLNKAIRKGRTKEEVNTIITWLTGYPSTAIAKLLEESITYGQFFEQAPLMNPKRALITGTVCGVRVEDIQEPLMRDIRYLDKLIDELANGKALDRILRA